MTSANVGELLVAKPSANPLQRSVSAVGVYAQRWLAPSVSKGDVGGLCRRVVSTRSARTYGLPFRSILLYTHRYARLLFSILDFGATFILPIALPADGAVSTRAKTGIPRKPRCIYTVSILYRDFQGLSGIFRDIGEGFQGNSASLRSRGAIGCRQELPALQPLALGPPAAERKHRGPGDNRYICEPSS